MTTPMPDEVHTHTCSCHGDVAQARWSCMTRPTPTPGAACVDPPPVDVRDMLVVHTAMLREFALRHRRSCASPPATGGTRRSSRSTCTS